MAEWSSPEMADTVLAYLRENANEDGEVTVSFRGLAAELDTSRGTARNALRRLVDNNVIQLARLGTGHRYASRYVLLESARVESEQLSMAGPTAPAA